MNVRFFDFMKHVKKRQRGKCVCQEARSLTERLATLVHFFWCGTEGNADARDATARRVIEIFIIVEGDLVF